MPTRGGLVEGSVSNCKTVFFPHDGRKAGWTSSSPASLLLWSSGGLRFRGRALPHMMFESEGGGIIEKADVVRDVA